MVHILLHEGIWMQDRGHTGRILPFSVQTIDDGLMPVLVCGL